MDEKLVGGFEARSGEHSRPKQCVKIHNVFADEVIKLIIGAVPDFVEIESFSVAIVFCRGHISDWRIEPDIKEFVFFAGYFEAEIGPIA